jgi:hypothetical protein
MRIRHAIGALIYLLIALTRSIAHNYWLEPETFFPTKGKPMSAIQ